MKDKTDHSPSTCPGCGREFRCGFEAGLETCWCMEMPLGAPVSEAGGRCYCPECLARQRQEAEPGTP